MPSPSMAERRDRSVHSYGSGLHQSTSTRTSGQMLMTSSVAVTFATLVDAVLVDAALEVSLGRQANLDALLPNGSSLSTKRSTKIAQIGDVTLS
jgi:hypothetical protein